MMNLLKTFDTRRFEMLFASRRISRDAAWFQASTNHPSVESTVIGEIINVLIVLAK
jgi:hypothetical protein